MIANFYGLPLPKVRVCAWLPKTVKDRDGNDVPLLGVMTGADGRMVMLVGEAEERRMTERESFLVAIRAQPDDFTLRLIFADWLEERGDLAAFGWRWLGLHRLQPATMFEVRTVLWNESSESMPLDWLRWYGPRDRTPTRPGPEMFCWSDRRLVGANSELPPDALARMVEKCCGVLEWTPALHSARPTLAAHALLTFPSWTYAVEVAAAAIASKVPGASWPPSPMIFQPDIRQGQQLTLLSRYEEPFSFGFPY